MELGISALGISALSVIGHSSHAIGHCYAAFVIYEVGGGEAEPDLARLTEANHVLARVADPAALAELRSSLRCVPGAQRPALMTPGEPTVALFAPDRQYPTSVTVVGSNRVRSHGLLQGDVLLAQPERRHSRKAT